MSLAFQPQPPILAPTTTGDQFPVRRIFCVGRNYAAHAREMGRDPDREPPFFFTAWAETIAPDGATIAYPQATRDYQHEVELVVAIGRAGRDIAVADAMDHVFGYAIGLDMTRRDLQAAAKDLGRPWDVAKNVEQGSPLGPIHPAAAFDPSRGGITLAVNGQERQAGDLADMIWPVADVVAQLSGLYRLEPGDLIYTGTPAGVGPVVPGDVMVGRIDGLGSLNHHRRRSGLMILHGYFRSSAAWRVRIALGLKGLRAADAFHHLRKGEHRMPDFLAVNPQGFVPALQLDDGAVLTQSLAICEYLDETVPEPSLLPGHAVMRARIRGFAQVVACDIHPVQNLKILKRLRENGLDDAGVEAWAQQVIGEGLDALETLIAGQEGPFAFGSTPTLADVCLIPQLGNARRFGVEIRWPRIAAIEAACAGVPAFVAARPENQPDAE